MNELNTEASRTNGGSDNSAEAREKTACLCAKRKVISGRCSNPNHSAPPLTMDKMREWLDEMLGSSRE